jgi:hypothetical protein
MLERLPAFRSRKVIRLAALISSVRLSRPGSKKQKDYDCTKYKMVNEGTMNRCYYGEVGRWWDGR